MTNSKVNVEEKMPSGAATPSTSSKNTDVPVLEAQMAKLEMGQRRHVAITIEHEEEMIIPATLIPAPTGKTYPTPEEKAEIDSRSVFVGNVDYNVSTQELGAFFQGCGIVKRVTIPVDKYSGNPKGFAYVEFADKCGANKAMTMANALLKERHIKVSEKRTNKPGISTTNRMPRAGFPAGTTSGGVAVGYIYPGGLPPCAPGMTEVPIFLNNLA